MNESVVLLCVSCNQKIQAGIYNEDFANILLKILVLLLFLIPLILTYFKGLTTNPAIADQRSVKTKIMPVIIFSLTIGIGMGGFIDGIVLHQILQWHQMISTKLPPVTFETKSINMFWDGIFEAVSWIFTFAGILLMWHASGRKDLNLSNSLFTGGLIAGWGVFNLLDSILNHYLYRFHHVRENVPNVAAWDIGFLILSLLMILTGYLLIKRVK